MLNHVNKSVFLNDLNISHILILQPKAEIILTAPMFSTRSQNVLLAIEYKRKKPNRHESACVLEPRKWRQSCNQSQSKRQPVAVMVKSQKSLSTKMGTHNPNLSLFHGWMIWSSICLFFLLLLLALNQNLNCSSFSQLSVNGVASRFCLIFLNLSKQGKC